MPDNLKLKISINREDCISDGACCEEAPETFEMDNENKAVVRPCPGDDRDRILDAAKCCPIDAITVVDEESGQQLHP